VIITIYKLDFSRTFRGVNTDFFLNFSDIFLISPTSDPSDFLLNRAVCWSILMHSISNITGNINNVQWFWFFHFKNIFYVFINVREKSNTVIYYKTPTLTIRRRKIKKWDINLYLYICMFLRLSFLIIWMIHSKYLFSIKVPFLICTHSFHVNENLERFPHAINQSVLLGI
jgi:hypothetical protein